MPIVALDLMDTLVSGSGHPRPLPSAAAALVDVRTLGEDAGVIVSSLPSETVRDRLRRAGLPDDIRVVDAVRSKSAVLREQGVAIMVTDSVGDVFEAVDAGVYVVAVTTGDYGRDQLLLAGAEEILDSLEQFPAVLARHVVARAPAIPPAAPTMAPDLSGTSTVLAAEHPAAATARPPAAGQPTRHVPPGLPGSSLGRPAARPGLRPGSTPF